MKCGQEEIAFLMFGTLPPDVKTVEEPEPGMLRLDGPVLFVDMLYTAAFFVYEDGDTRLLEALRAKWPEAVEEAWPKASEMALKELKIIKHPAPFEARREPARMAAMA